MIRSQGTLACLPQAGEGGEETTREGVEQSSKSLQHAQISHARICDACLEKHLRQVEGFASVPRGEVEWDGFWARNIQWQLKRMKEHCGRS